MTYKIGAKGQVVIEKAIRDALGVEPGSVAFQKRVGDHVEIRFYPAEHMKSLRGMLARARKRSLPAGELDQAAQRAWPNAAAREWKRDSENG